jgi:hypothetical protein
LPDVDQFCLDLRTLLHFAEQKIRNVLALPALASGAQNDWKIEWFFGHWMKWVAEFS